MYNLRVFRARSIGTQHLLLLFCLFPGPEDEDKDKPVRDIDSEDDLIGKVGGILEYV